MRFLALLALWLTAPAFASPNIPGLHVGAGTSMQGLGTPASTPNPPDGDAPPLVPGSTPIGSWAATSVPATQGSGSTFITVGQWSLVPRQAVTDADNNICVVAYSGVSADDYAGGDIYGISKVQFIANNGTPADITTTTTTGRAAPLVEYCAGIDLSGVSAGATIEIRAVIYPKNGVPIVLQGADTNFGTATWGQKGLYSLFVQAKPTAVNYWVAATGGSNSNNCTTSSTECATIAGALGKISTATDLSSHVICLRAGSYSLAADVTTDRTAATGYLTITPCAGVAKADVTISSWGGSTVQGAQVTKIHLKGLQIAGGASKVYNIAGPTTLSKVWLEDVDWVNHTDCRILSGSTASECQFALSMLSGKYSGGSFATETRFENFGTATFGLVLGRNVEIDHINADAFQNARTVLNATITNVINCCQVHADINQQGSSEAWNHIMAGVVASTNIDSAGMFASPDGLPDPSGAIQTGAYVHNTVNNAVNPGRNSFSLDTASTNYVVIGGSYGPGPHYKKSTNYNPIYIIDVTCTGTGSFGSATIRGSPTC